MPNQHHFLWNRNSSLALCLILVMVLALFLDNNSPKNITLAESPSSRNIGVMIVSPGKFPIQGKYLEAIGIEQTKERILRITLFTSSGTEKPIADLGERWFIYPETPDRIWIYYGNDILQLQEYSKKPICSIVSLVEDIFDLTDPKTRFRANPTKLEKETRSSLQKSSCQRRVLRIIARKITSQP